MTPDDLIVNRPAIIRRRGFLASHTQRGWWPVHARALFSPYCPRNSIWPILSAVAPDNFACFFCPRNKLRELRIEEH